MVVRLTHDGDEEVEQAHAEEELVQDKQNPRVVSKSLLGGVACDFVHRPVVDSGLSNVAQRVPEDLDPEGNLVNNKCVFFFLRILVEQIDSCD